MLEGLQVARQKDFMNVLLHIDSKSVVDNLTNDCKDSVVGMRFSLGPWTLIGRLRFVIILDVMVGWT